MALIEVDGTGYIACKANAIMGRCYADIFFFGEQFMKFFFQPGDIWYYVDIINSENFFFTSPECEVGYTGRLSGKIDFLGCEYDGICNIRISKGNPMHNFRNFKDE